MQGMCVLPLVGGAMKSTVIPLWTFYHDRLETVHQSNRCDVQATATPIFERASAPAAAAAAAAAAPATNDDKNVANVQRERETLGL